MSKSVGKATGPKAGSKEDYLKRKMEICIKHTPTAEYPNCYASYDAAKKEFTSYSREEKKRKKSDMAPMDKVHELLSSASKFSKSADKFNENGKIPQANGARKKAEQCLSDADEMFKKNYDLFSDEEMQSLSEQEVTALKTKSLDAFISASANESAASSPTQTEQLLQKKVKTYKRYVDELTTEVEQALPFVEEPTHKERLQKLLQKRKRGASAAATPVS
jgi:hypothetical protein